MSSIEDSISAAGISGAIFGTLLLIIIIIVVIMLHRMKKYKRVCYGIQDEAISIKLSDVPAADHNTI